MYINAKKRREFSSRQTVPVISCRTSFSGHPVMQAITVWVFQCKIDDVWFIEIAVQFLHYKQHSSGTTPERYWDCYFYISVFKDFSFIHFWISSSTILCHWMMVWIGKNGKISTFLIFGFEINQNTTILRNCWQQSQFCALIAQSVEQVTLNHWVLGSNPRERTIFLSFFLIEFYDALP